MTASHFRGLGNLGVALGEPRCGLGYLFVALAPTPGSNGVSLREASVLRSKRLTTTASHVVGWVICLWHWLQPLARRATSKIEIESLPGGLRRVRATASHVADVRERAIGGVHGIV